MQTIKSGSIVEIDGKKYKLGGDAVEVTPITELEVGASYKLKRNSQFCHSLNRDGITEGFEEGDFIFVGTIQIGNGIRNIFYGEGTNAIYYAMFSAKNLDYVIEKL